MRWTTIGLSAPTLKPVEAPPAPVDRKKRIASIWIPAILAIGLLTSFTYLGVRIAAAKSQAVVSAPRPATVAQAPATTSAPVPAEPTKPVSKPAPKSAPKAAVQPTNFTIITPQGGERYIQLAAVTPHMVLSYVDDLRKLNLEAVVVAPGPSPELLRVLVGPFADSESLDRAKARLETAGRRYLVRVY